jgi:hypothetical protein
MLSADDAVAAECDATRRGPEATAIRQAEEFLREMLADGPKPQSEIIEAWEAEGGSIRTLRRAKANLNVWSKRETRHSPWKWGLPETDNNEIVRLPSLGCQVSREKKLGNLGNLSQNTGKITDFDDPKCQVAKFPLLGNLMATCDDLAVPDDVFDCLREADPRD